MGAAVARNIAKAWLLVGILAGGFAGLGWLIGDSRGAMLFGFCSLLAAVFCYAYCDRAILGALEARTMALAENPILVSTVERLSAQLHITPPKLAVIRDGFPRCFVVGRGPGSATLAFSTSLIGALTPSELEAVLAHELAHVRSRDVLTQTFAVFLSTTLLGALTHRRLVLAGSPHRDRPGRSRVHPPPALTEARARGRPRRRHLDRRG